MNKEQLEKMKNGKGFIAALDKVVVVHQKHLKNMV